MSRPITSYVSAFAPRFFIEADGEPANELIRYVTKFEYEDDETKFDKLSLTVVNPGLRFKDSKLFKEGIRLRVRFGYLSDISDVKEVVIAHARPRFDMKPMIEMTAFNLTLYLNRKANPYNWGAISSSAVAKTIASRYRFDTDIEESNDARRQHRLQPVGVSDIQYLMGLAKPLNWDCYVEGNVLHFHKKRYEAPAALEFVYFSDQLGTLLSFHPDVNLTKPISPGVAGADTKTGTSQAGVGDQNTRYREINSDAGSISGPMVANSAKSPVNFSGERGLHGSTPESDSRVIQIHGAAKAQAVDTKAIQASAEMVGTPRLRARTMIRISGVDQQYSGNWRVSKAKHVIDAHGVYKTSVHLRRDAGKAKSPNDNKKAPDGSGTTKPNTVTVSNDRGRISGIFSP